MNTLQIEQLLDEFGFGVGKIVETVVATRNSDFTINAAPMGVKRVGSNLIEISPYKSSKSYHNLNERESAVINITNDPNIFLVTSFKEESFLNIIKPNFKEDMSMVNADASLFWMMIKKENFEERGSFLGKISSINVQKRFANVFSRGISNAIEAVIYSTHIKYNIQHKNFDEVSSQITKVKKCEEIVERVSGKNSDEYKVVQNILYLIDKWRCST